jgi:asparagine synthase (glutamine-hydrolysing)
MSGFFVQYNLDGAPVAKTILTKLRGMLVVQDDEGGGVWFDGAVGMACACFGTTTDTTPEQQPRSFDGKVYLVADARIDGRGDLIGALNTRGRQRILPDAPDPDLILHAWQAWGKKCLEQIIGDFSFVIWDGRERNLFCAHDHFGVGQIYYAHLKKCLLISNSLNCLLQHPLVSRTLNETFVGDYLIHGYNQSLETTIYADIFRLPPGQALTAGAGTVQLSQYWQPPDPGQTDYINRNPLEIVEEFRSLFKTAVKDRIRTDRVALHLSGGMDSSSIAAAAKLVLDETGRPFTLKAYTIAYRHLIEHEEDKYAALTADFYQIPREILIAEDYLCNSPTPPNGPVHPQPLGIPSLLAEYDIIKRASGFSRVLLVGFGGDPAFYVANRSIRTLLHHFGLWALVGAGSRNLKARFKRVLQACLRFAKKPQDHSESSLFVPAWFNYDFTTRVKLVDRVAAVQESYSNGTLRGINGMSRAPLWSTLFTASHPEYLLTPLVARYPFFDKRLLDFLAIVPPLPWLYRKHLLREAMRGQLPEKVRLRPKTTLNGEPYYHDWRTNGLRPWMRELMAAPWMEPFINAKQWENVLRNVDRDGTRHIMFSINAFSLSYWLKYVN